MPRLNRSEICASDEVQVFHLINRCVRRTYLCGREKRSGKDYSHRKEWIRDTGNNQAYRFGALPFQRTRRLAWHVTQHFNHTAYMRQRFRAHMIAAVDDARDRGSAYACFAGHVAEGRMNIGSDH